MAEAIREISNHWPKDHFIKYVKIECDALRDGKPKGRRHYLNVVFQPYPER